MATSMRSAIYGDDGGMESPSGEAVSAPFGGVGGGMGGGAAAGGMGGGAGGLESPGFQSFQPAAGFGGAGAYDGGMYGGGMGGDMGGDMQQMQELDEDDGDDRPLLEELGINFDHIWKKTQAVLMPTRALPPDILQDRDFAGPLVICLALGFSLLLTGKVHFGYIYGIGAMGCLGMYMVLNLMTGSSSAVHAQHGDMDFMRVLSIQGYCLLPIAVLAVIAIVFDLRNVIGTILTVLAIAWSTLTSTRFFEQAMNMRAQRFLIAYPVCLQFACFALITVF